MSFTQVNGSGLINVYVYDTKATLPLMGALRRPHTSIMTTHAET